MECQICLGPEPIPCLSRRLLKPIPCLNCRLKPIPCLNPRLKPILCLNPRLRGHCSNNCRGKTGRVHVRHLRGENSFLFCSLLSSFLFSSSKSNCILFFYTEGAFKSYRLLVINNNLYLHQNLDQVLCITLPIPIIVANFNR